MNFKEKFDQIFAYKPNSSHEFLIPNSPNNLPTEKESKVKVFDSYDKNFEYLKVKYNLLINSDINIREFEINISNKKIKAFLIFVDGMTKTEMINNNILAPLLIKNSIHMKPFNNPKLNNIQKFDLKNFIYKNLLTQNVVELSNDFKEIFEKINIGFSILFVDTINTAFCIETKDIKGRAITEPKAETVVRGAQVSFVENLRTNTSLIRKIINNENLIIENTKVGKITRNEYINLLYEKHNK